MPGVSIGTMNMLMPACAGLASRSVRAARNMYFPHQVVVQIFWPLMTQRVAVARTALVRSAARSEPASWLAVTHAMHGLATKDFRQVFLLLRRRAEHHQRVGLDRRADPRRLAALHRLHEGDLLERRSRLATEVARPAQADPAGLADIAREVSVELALGERPGVERRLACAVTNAARATRAPVAQRRCRPAPRSYCGSAASAIVEQIRRQFAPGRGGAAQRERIEMHALEVSRGLVLFGIADGAERMLRLERRPGASASPAKATAAIGKIAPVAVARDRAASAA